jgi:hypothetical protein
MQEQNCDSGGRARQHAEGLKTERPNQHPPTQARRHKLGQVGGRDRIVGAHTDAG